MNNGIGHQRWDALARMWRDVAAGSPVMDGDRIARTMTFMDAAGHQTGDARMSVAERAKRFLPADYQTEGKADPDIKRAAVERYVGQPSHGKSDAYIAAAFRIMESEGIVPTQLAAAQPAAAGVAEVRKDAAAAYIPDAADVAYDAMCHEQSNAWRGKGA